MKTPQILLRPFKDGYIRQNHKSKWFNATDLSKIANSYRTQIGLTEKKIADYLKNDSTKEFAKEIMDKEDISKVYEAKKGKNGGTWVHPLILIDFAMWLSPEFKYVAISWLHDNLTLNRDTSGDSYRELSSQIAKNSDIPPSKIGLAIPIVAKNIKKLLNVDDWNMATTEQLHERDVIHKSLIMMIKAKVTLKTAMNIVISEYRK